MAFVDEFKIYMKAGDGGNGVERWRHEKGREFAGPAGGDGGNGGDVYVRAVRDIHILAKYRHEKEFHAGRGGNGGNNSLHGANGEDFVLDLPIGSVVRNLNTGEEVSLLEEGQKIMVLKGGRGGYGNEHFKSATNRSPKEHIPGTKGFDADFYIELQIVADLGLIGLPNAGKSSLLNKLAGKERAIVSPIAGTTRDAIDTKIEFDGIPVTLIDTAGIRRRGKIEPGVEQFSVIRSFKAIERADVALLLIDATTGISSQDAHIAGFILEAWKSCVVLVNKWDAVEKNSYSMDEYTRKIRADLNFMDYVPLLFISAKTGQRVEQVMPMALRVQEERLARLATSKINKVLVEAQDAHAAPSHAGRQLKIFYGTQVRSDPPTFMIYVNDPKLMHFSYLRFLENRLREEYGFLGTPIRIVTKGRRDE